jgi:hypothetical protein
VSMVGRGNEVESTTTVVTVDGNQELDILSVEEVVEDVGVIVDEETIEGEELPDELVLRDQFSTSQPSVIRSGGHTIREVTKRNFVIWRTVQKEDRRNLHVLTR